MQVSFSCKTKTLSCWGALWDILFLPSSFLKENSVPLEYVCVWAAQVILELDKDVINAMWKLVVFPTMFKSNLGQIKWLYIKRACLRTEEQVPRVKHSTIFFWSFPVNFRIRFQGRKTTERQTKPKKETESVRKTTFHTPFFELLQDDKIKLLILAWMLLDIS